MTPALGSIRSSRSLFTEWHRLLWRALIALTVAALAACGGDSDLIAPTISQQPADTTVVEGGNATFTVVASGNAPTYLWESSSDGSSWSAVTGATGPSLTLSAVTAAMSGTSYRVQVTSDGITLASSAARLTVTSAAVALAITVQPAAQRVVAPAAASFSVTVTGTSPAYLWQRADAGGSTWTNLSGATGPTFTTGATDTAMSGQRYRVVVSNSLGAVTSNEAVLTVDAAPVQPAFTTQPADQAVIAPDSATFTVAATGTPAPTVRWQASTDGGATFVDIAGATAATFNTGTTSTSMSGTRYRAVATNSAGSATSNAAALTVSPTPVAPSVTTQPQSQAVTVPTTATFTAAASGVPTPTNQWQLSTDGGTSYANINGATALSYTTPATTTADSGKRYRAIFSNSAGTATSNPATLTVNSPTLNLAVLAGLVGGRGNLDGTGAAARFNYPYSVAIDASGNLYVADTNNNEIRKVTPAGTVSTLAGAPGFGGSSDGVGSAARFRQPTGIAIDSGGTLYVADQSNHTIRKITPAGLVSTFAGTAGSPGSTDATGTDARFYLPTGVAVDAAGTVYVTDQYNSTIRAITPSGVVTTLAGATGINGHIDANGAAARFDNPTGVAVDAAGTLYVADQSGQSIRKISSTAEVTTLAGTYPLCASNDGTGAAARFCYPTGIAVDAAGTVYVADQNNFTIRKITAIGEVTTLAGTAPIYGSADGTGVAARFSYPAGVAVDAAGNVYVADAGNATIRKITPAAVVTTLAGMPAETSGADDGTGTAARFNYPIGAAVDASGNVYVADTYNSTIRRITPAGVVSTFAGTAGATGSVDGNGAAARFSYPSGVAVDTTGNVYVVDRSNSTIRKVTPGGDVTTLAGSPGVTGTDDGTGGAARFNQPYGVAVDASGYVYVAESNSRTIRKISPAGEVTTLAGTPGASGSVDGTGPAARFGQPTGVAADGAGNLYVADLDNHTIRKITPAGEVTTLAGTAYLPGSADGTGPAARFNYPVGVAVDPAGNVYVSDRNNSTIRKITPAGVVTTVVGVAGQAGVQLGGDPRINSPQGIAVIDANHLVVVDQAAHAVLIVTIP